jgi:ABC-type transporter Mla MlaB component
LRESCFVELAGALSARTRAPLAEALEDALETDAEEIVLDLARLEAIDRAGLATVLTAHLRAADELKRLLIIPGPTPVQHVFDEARGPFLYASGKAARVSGRARSRDGRTGRSTLRRPGTRRGAAW